MRIGRPDHRAEAAACAAALAVAAAVAAYALAQLSGPDRDAWFVVAGLACLALIVAAIWSLVLCIVAGVDRVRGRRPRPGRGGRADTPSPLDWAAWDREAADRLSDAWTEAYRAADTWTAGPADDAGMARRRAGDPRTREMPAVGAGDGRPADEPSADRDDLLMGEPWTLAVRYGARGRNGFSL